MRSAMRGRTAAVAAFAAAFGLAVAAASLRPGAAAALDAHAAAGVLNHRLCRQRAQRPLDDAGAGGTLFVGTRTAGNVYAVVDANKDQRADRVVTAGKGPGHAERRGRPQRLAVRGRGVTHHPLRQHRGVARHASGADRGRRRVSQGSAHGWKFLAFGPDGWLYVPVGAPCNVCERRTRATRPSPASGRTAPARRSSPAASAIPSGSTGTRSRGTLVHRQRARHAGRRPAARRVERRTHEGPALRLSLLPRRHDCRPGVRRETPVLGVHAPARTLGPHVAALGMRFYNGSMFPAALRNQIFIAEHGSWNRSTRSATGS